LPPLSAAVYASAAYYASMPRRHIAELMPRHFRCRYAITPFSPCRLLRLMIFAIFASPPDAIFDAAAIFITLRLIIIAFDAHCAIIIIFIACFSMPLRWLSPAPLSPSAIG
jgi:hypothetical protein